MGRINEQSMKILLTVPVSHIERLKELMKERFDFMSDYFRYMIRKEILSHGPLPKPIAKTALRRETVSAPPPPSPPDSPTPPQP